ncbi:MAG: hypothetical protein AAGH70_08520 [Pseudomonadota bacterium]
MTQAKLWIKMKCYKGLTVESVAKMHKIKKPADIWTYEDNRKLKKAYDKTKGFADGDMLSIPDPKQKVYVVEYKGTKYMLDISEKKKFDKMLGARMDEVNLLMRRAFDKTKTRHDSQKAVNADNRIAHAFSRSWLTSKEPGIQLAFAKSAVAALGSCVASRDYKTFEARAKACEKAINSYRNALHKWIDSLSSSAENIAFGLTVTKEASFIIFGAAAMAATAPVSLPTAMAAGALIGGGTAFVSSASTELSKSLVNDKFNAEKSFDKIMRETSIGLGVGALGGGFSKAVRAKVITNLYARVLTTATLKKVAKKVYDGETKLKGGNYISKHFDNAVVKKTEHLEGKMRTVVRKRLQGNKMLFMQTTLVKVVGKTGKADVEKILEAATRKATNEKLLRLNASGKVGADKIAKDLAAEFEKGPVMDVAYGKLLEKNKSKIETELDAQIRDLVEKLSKVARMT